MRSLSREKDLRSPQAAQHNRLMEFQATRNETINRPMLMYNQIKNQTAVEGEQAKYSYPVYARSTKNLVRDIGLFLESEGK